MSKTSELKISFYKGKGPGGQNKNKVETACRIVHVPTGAKVEIDEQRTRGQNRKIAIKKIWDKVTELQVQAEAAKKKEKRDHAIHNTPTIRTYDYKSGLVRDHRTGKSAPIKQVVGKGKIELLR